jgi:small neutral amino acid transporter SnatA (MarC family)
LLRDTAMQFMGLIVVAMGVQFALTGLHSFFVAQP